MVGGSSAQLCGQLPTAAPRSTCQLPAPWTTAVCARTHTLTHTHAPLQWAHPAQPARGRRRRCQPGRAWGGGRQMWRLSEQWWMGGWVGAHTRLAAGAPLPLSRSQQPMRPASQQASHPTRSRHHRGCWPHTALLKDSPAALPAFLAPAALAPWPASHTRPASLPPAHHPLTQPHDKPKHAHNYPLATLSPTHLISSSTVSTLASVSSSPAASSITCSTSRISCDTRVHAHSEGRVAGG